MVCDMKDLSIDLAKELHDLILWGCKRGKDGKPKYPKFVYLYKDRFFMSNPSKYAKELNIELSHLQKIIVVYILAILGKSL